MTDVLKLAEEALEPFAFFERQWKAARRNAERPVANEIYGIHMGTEFAAMLTHSHLQAADDALTAIRSARAEWGWRPIAEWPAIVRGALHLGTWVEGHGWATMKSKTYSRGMAENGGWTHFYIEPQLPPPPTREEKYDCVEAR